MTILSRSEEMYMVAIWELEDEAYGVAIRRRVTEKTGKMISYGALYIALDQLLKKGYVDKIPGEPTAKRGGRKKFFYTLTDPGIEVLKRTYAHQKALWTGVSGLIGESGGQ